MDADADLEVCSWVRLDSSCWRAIAQLTASTALPNSARTLSPAVLAIRPRCCSDLVLRGLSDGSKGSESPSLVRLHELGVANDIRRHDGGEAAFWFGLMVRHWMPKVAENSEDILQDVRRGRENDHQQVRIRSLRRRKALSHY